MSMGNASQKMRAFDQKLLQCQKTPFWLDFSEVGRRRRGQSMAFIVIWEQQCGPRNNNVVNLQKSWITIVKIV